MRHDLAERIKEVDELVMGWIFLNLSDFGPWQENSRHDVNGAYLCMLPHRASTSFDLIGYCIFFWMGLWAVTLGHVRRSMKIYVLNIIKVYIYGRTRVATWQRYCLFIGYKKNLKKLNRTEHWITFLNVVHAKNC